ncbi:hypothetical protein SARC_00576 [Sphaeroforma arctica JP610]|uniref:dolichol kinase n=1 Tax=Sphaeroforma arctica JP610 TaxID=667725 RepID=A0A0L0GE58_9EUKA|nr:hypothetical protein SARC_00576 [Sphaeroforma arctica JP610]KNC87295.1 hypothetical protein SARC_00576 [Sphaeroforma arctica JP610]|eukprot:XP_014161197.1 hypothetical protein SARC_00576 [Sphaeroforma arctica JP610]
MFTPAFLSPAGAEFMRLAFAVAVSAFVLLEYLRIARVWPLGEDLQDFLTKFTDERDSGPVILTHLYLLVGIALPLWLTSSMQSIGIGDATASFVGVRYGVHKWGASTKYVIDS